MKQKGKLYKTYGVSYDVKVSVGQWIKCDEMKMQVAEMKMLR